jgi:hypothetical protein
MCGVIETKSRETSSRNSVKGKAIPLQAQQALRVPAGWGSQILRQSAHEGGKVVSPMHWLPLPPGNIPGTHFC